MSIMEKVRTAVREFLKIEPAEVMNVTVKEQLSFSGAAFRNRLWYRGDAQELSQFYQSIKEEACSFWGSVPSEGLEIRKIHTGLPKIMVNILAGIVLRDLGEITLEDVSKNDLWKAVEAENGFPRLLQRALKQVLSVGDGAFKISFDPKVSKLPIVEFYRGDQVKLQYQRGRIHEAVFVTEYRKNTTRYYLNECYGWGYVKYKLYCDGMPVELTMVDELARLQDVDFDPSVMMAVPFLIDESDKYEGRGQSIFEGKIYNFDALDEAWSQWVDALRAGRSRTYIPDCLIPRDSETGALLKPNAFDNRFIRVETDASENAKRQIEVTQPTIPTDGYLQTYITALDLCLQGVISPSTLGIDVKKLDNAEAQREKEKATLYTRGNIVAALNDVLPQLINMIFKADAVQNKRTLEDTEVSVTFGEYANPSFEAVVETLSNPNTPMSVEAKVEEMWGDSKSREWKDKEVKRIKEQTGIAELDEPALGGETFDSPIRSQGLPNEQESIPGNAENT